MSEGSENPAGDPMLRAKPLAGRTVVVTRAPHQSGPWRDRLSRLGAAVVEAPLLEIARTSEPEVLQQAICHLDEPDIVVVTSANGARAWLEVREAWQRKTAEILPEPRFLAAVGQRTAGRLRRGGLQVDLIPEHQRGEALLQELVAIGVEDRKILLLQGDRADSTLQDGLLEAGAAVRRVEAYRTACVPDSPALTDALAALADAILFSSASTAEAAARCLAPATLSDGLGRCKVFSIGPSTTRRLHQLGIEDLTEADPHSLEGLCAALVAELGSPGGGR